MHDWRKIKWPGEDIMWHCYKCGFKNKDPVPDPNVLVYIFVGPPPLQHVCNTRSPIFGLPLVLTCDEAMLYKVHES